jgi:hypothetical protein
METLLALNVSGAYAAGPSGRGFVCRSDGATLRLKGVTKLINRRFKKARGAAAAGNGRTLRLFALPSGAVPTRNTMANGERIHRHVLHRLMCGRPYALCQCHRIYGGATATLHTQSESVKACVRAAETFAEDHALVPLAGEVIVHHAPTGVGTRIDALFRSKRTLREHGAGERAPVVLVSWKSGAGPRDLVELERHRAQVAFEWTSLQETHHVTVEAAHIVYLTPVMRRGTHRVDGYYHAEPVARAAVPALVKRLQPTAREVAKARERALGLKPVASKRAKKRKQ